MRDSITKILFLILMGDSITKILFLILMGDNHEQGNIRYTGENSAK